MRKESKYSDTPKVTLPTKQGARETRRLLVICLSEASEGREDKEGRFLEETSSKLFIFCDLFGFMFNAANLE